MCYVGGSDSQAGETDTQPYINEEGLKLERIIQLSIGAFCTQSKPCQQWSSL